MRVIISFVFVLSSLPVFAGQLVLQGLRGDVETTVTTCGNIVSVSRDGNSQVQIVSERGACTCTIPSSAMTISDLVDLMRVTYSAVGNVKLTLTCGKRYGLADTKNHPEYMNLILGNEPRMTTKDYQVSVEAQ